MTPTSPPNPPKKPGWTSAEYWSHVLVVAVLAAAAIVSFTTAGTHHLPDWLPAVVAPLSVVLAVVAQGLYLLHANGLGKKGWESVGKMAETDWAALAPALTAVARDVPGLAQRLDDARSALTAAQAAAPAPAPAPAATPAAPA